MEQHILKNVDSC